MLEQLPFPAESVLTSIVSFHFGLLEGKYLEAFLIHSLMWSYSTSFCLLFIQLRIVTYSIMQLVSVPWILTV